MTAMDRFFARLNRQHNAHVIAERIDPEAHLGRVGNPYLKPVSRPKRPKPAVRTYKATPPAPTPEQVEAERQSAILATRLANLEKARAVRAANRASQQQPKETAPVSEIETLRAQIAALSAQIERLSAPQVAPRQTAPVAPKPASKPTPVAPAKAKPAYVATSVPLTNHKHGRYSLQMERTMITLCWNGAERRWDYICGKVKGSAADRGTAVAQINALLANAGLPPVRA
jgi:hypothetical protein